MERPSFSYRSIYTAFALSLAAGFVAALYIFSRFTTYQADALKRIPESADFVVRLNVQQAVLHAPLKQYVLPLLERDRAGPESRLKHLERKTTLELEVDVRELIYAELDRERFLMILAGFLRPDEVLEGVGRLLDEEGISYEKDDELLVHSGGVSFGVATDGTLVLGSGPIETRAALALDGSFPTWAPALMPPGMALGIYAAPRERNSGLNALPSHLRGGTFVVTAESYFPLEAEVGLRGESWTVSQVDALFSSKSNDFTYLVPLDGLRFVTQQGPQFRVRSNLGRAQFDETVMRLAMRITGTLGRAKKPKHGAP